MTHLSAGFGLKQIVPCATLGKKTLDKIIPNLYQYYQSPTNIGAIDTSDHDAILAVPSLPNDWEAPFVVR